MSRAALTRHVLAAALAFSAAWYGNSLAAGTVNPHLDPGLVPGGCSACHRGHGAPRSPMLPTPLNRSCQACHGSTLDLQRMTARGMLSAAARPALLSSVLAAPYTHPLSEASNSRHEPGVTCTSCHSPHRGSPAAGTVVEGRPRMSPLDPTRFEYEMCETCHGSQGAATQNLTDISRLLIPENRSYHPVVAPTLERSPSVRASLSGLQINCTDCHGNSDPRGPRGVHGSAVAFILTAPYTTSDGAGESATAYAHCYGCHDRSSVLERSPFPEHKKHVVDEQASCATCHNGHGSVNNRAMIRFGEETTVAGVAPSGSGRIGFISAGPGAGSCYLTCHGEDHDPLSYGTVEGVAGLAAPVSTVFPAPAAALSPTPAATPLRPRKLAAPERPFP